jgi:CO/xanthine dehydrogenase Mo-binding subunit/aerobic-type carbon monoxide dehydrogenase small subunit (CoxS/CutS family)
MLTPSSSSLACTVNGRAVTVDTMPHRLLLDVLREQLGLKGAKRSCDIQVCGACTVLVDGAPVSACTYLAVEAEGREIRTVEGLADGETLHAVQAAFVEHGAIQCGFCTSGMLLSTAALLEENPSPTREQILHYLRGNLCRCTGYQKIVDAIASCATAAPSPSPLPRDGGEGFKQVDQWNPLPHRERGQGEGAGMTPAEPLRVVGHSVRRVDGLEKVTGRARYVTDMELPGMLHVKLLRSPYPHAKILRTDVSRARVAAGVRAAVTSADLDWCDPYYGPAFRDRPILAIEVTRYEGEPVAAVVAESESAAALALELIEIVYEELPAVTTLEEALAPGAPLVHTAEPPAGHFADLSTLKPKPGTNICHQFHLERGHGAQAFAGADIVVEDVYTFPRVQHYSMEPHAALAAWDEQGTLTVWASTQNPYSVRVELAKMFRVPMSRIRIIVPPLGGGFGGKTYAKLEPIVGALARMVGRPVRLALSVEEAFRTVRRCDASARVRLGFKRDGTLWAAECHADFDVGAYADIGPRIIQKGTYTATGPYRVPNIVLDAKAVYTNTTPGGAFRGFGVPQLAWALESLVDEAARDLGHDPVDLRRQNLLGQGEEFAPGDTPIDGKFEESLTRAAEAIRWTQETPPGRARGLAMMMKASVAPTVSEAIVRLHADASVTVLASTVEMGQGARTVMAQIAAEVLAVPVERVFVAMPDTAITPYDQTTSSSRSTTMTGKAVQEAAADVREQLLRIAGRRLRVDATELRLEDAAVISAGARLPYPELLAERFGMSGGELIGRGIVAPGRSAAPLGGSTPFWEMAVGAAEVSVDEETGSVTVHSYASVADVGRCINPQQCEGQDEGAVMQGIGHTLLEEMLYERGQLLNANLVDYRVPRADDVPGELQCRFVENGDGAGPFGAKGAGEGSLVPVSPAVGNALARLTGVRFRELPLTPERVWRALRQRQITRSRLSSARSDSERPASLL